MAVMELTNPAELDNVKSEIIKFMKEQPNAVSPEAVVSHFKHDSLVRVALRTLISEGQVEILSGANLGIREEKTR